MIIRGFRLTGRWRWAAAVILTLVAANVISVIVVSRDRSAASGPASTASGTSTATSGTRIRRAADRPVSAFAADRPAPRSGAGPCLQVHVLASLENADTVKALATSYMSRPRDVGGRCVHVDVRAQESGDAESDAAHGFGNEPNEMRPTIWVPDSSAWLRLAHESAGSSIPSSGTSVAESVVVVGMPAPLAAAIGWRTQAPSWAGVLQAARDPQVWARLGHPGWGTFKLGKTSPLTSTSGLLALVASFAASDAGRTTLTRADVQSPVVRAAVARSELATSHYMSTPQQFLFHAREAEQHGSLATFLSAMIMDEKTLWDYNRGSTGASSTGGMSGMSGMSGTSTMQSAPREKLVPVYPRDAAFGVDNPAAILAGNWVGRRERAAAADFVSFARTAQGQAVVRQGGFRDIDSRASTAEIRNGFTAPAPRTSAMPDASVLAAVQRSFPVVRKPARVLFLVDVSGSMGDRISRRVTKLDAAKQAISDAIRYLGVSDEVGLAAFSNRPRARLTPGLIIPVAPLRSNRAAFLGGVRGLRPVSQTPLYNAVDMFTAAMVKSYQPDKINAIVLLSDGHNDTDQTEGRPQLLTHLGAMHMRAPILVFTLAYGHDADTGTLNLIAETSGAHYYDATDPRTVNHVLAQDLVTSF